MGVRFVQYCFKQISPECKIFIENVCSTVDFTISMLSQRRHCEITHKFEIRHTQRDWGGNERVKGGMAWIPHCLLSEAGLMNLPIRRNRFLETISL